MGEGGRIGADDGLISFEDNPGFRDISLPGGEQGIEPGRMGGGEVVGFAGIGGEVIELECGITVYPARSERARWRAVWYEAGVRQQCEAATEEKLAPKLEKVAERLQADAPNMRLPGANPSLARVTASPRRWRGRRHRATRL